MVKRSAPDSPGQPARGKQNAWTFHTPLFPTFLLVAPHHSDGTRWRPPVRRAAVPEFSRATGGLWTQNPSTASCAVREVTTSVQGVCDRMNPDGASDVADLTRSLGVVRSRRTSLPHLLLCRTVAACSPESLGCCRAMDWPRNINRKRLPVCSLQSRAFPASQ